jgi:serine/threonine protein phosphatase PrpC
LLSLAQEDAHSIFLDLDQKTKTGFFGVFDGHGGKEVAKYAALHLVSASCDLPTQQCSCMPFHDSI